jgi:hypothetical protein
MPLSLSSFFARRGRNRTVTALARALRRLPDLERLEDRTVLSITFSNPATMSGDVTLTGTSGPDQFIVRLGTTSGTIQFSDDNGQTFTTANLAGITSVTVDGQGGNDRLTLDMSNGVIGTAGTSLPISFNAGGSGHSTLTLHGSPPAANGTVSEVFTAGTDARSGTLTVNAAGTTPAGAASDSITFTNVSTLRDTMNATSFTVNANDQNNAVLITNGPTVNGVATDVIQGLNTGGTGERDRDRDQEHEGQVGDDNGQGDDNNSQGDKNAGKNGKGDDNGQGDDKGGNIMDVDDSSADHDESRGNGFVTIQFANKTTVSVNTLGGNDLIVLNVTTPAAGLKTLNLDGGTGNNFLAVVNAPAGVTLNTANLPQSNRTTDSDDAFIEEQFEQDLDRPARMDELPFWKGVLNSGGQGAGRLNVIQGIERSDEGLDMQVRGLYRQYLGRDALNGEEMFWVSLLKDNETEEQVIAGILGSQEFFNLAQTQVTTGTPDERYITAVYQTLLGRTPQPSEVTYWTKLLQTTPDRTQAVMQFLESPEFRTDVITALYTSLLNRMPEQQGLSFWLNPHFSMEDIREGIMGSAEFAGRSS